VYKTLLFWTDNRRKSRTLTDRLVRHTRPTRWKNPAAADARNDLLDPDFANACATAAIPHLASGYIPPERAYYRVKLEPASTFEGRGLVMDMSIETDSDFDLANTFHRRAVPDAKFDNAAVLTGMFSVLADLKIAASFSEEMAVSPSVLAIAKIKLSQLPSKRD
jgi:hypothetical protein